MAPKIRPTKMLLVIISSLHMVLAMDVITKDLVTPAKQFGEGCGFDNCPTLSEETLNVHIIAHTHGELGYTGHFYNHYTGDFGKIHEKTEVNMKRVFDHTITELWADNERKFVLSDMAYFFYWWKQRDPTVHRMVYELIRQGRLQFVGGGFSMSDEATTSYHAIIDMFTYSLEKINSTFLECGRPLVSWQSDVFGHSREFAALMSQMGFNGHFVSPISYDDEVARMIAKSMEFVWRGSDDLGPYTELFTHKLFDGYWSPPGFCFGTFCTDQPIIENEEGFRNVGDRIKEFIELAMHRQGPYYTTKNIMVIFGQRFGYFDAGVWFSNIDKLIRHTNTRSATLGFPVKLFYSSPACYLKAVAEAKPFLSTKQDDFLPFAYDQNSMAVGIYTSRPTFKYFIRQGHVYLQISKQLQMTARLHAHHHDAIMDRLKWINSILQDHNIITGVLTENAKLFYTHKLYLALQSATTLNADAINKLRKTTTRTEYFRCSFNISLCQNTDADQYHIVIYNPLSWPVNVKVRLPTLNQDFIVFHPSGKRVKAGMMVIADPVFSIYRHRTHARHELVFIADDIPPIGFRSYFIKLKAKRSKRAILKKVNKKHKTKKYLVRQAYQNAITEDTPDDFGNFDYEYFESPVKSTPNTKIQFGSVESDTDNNEVTDSVVTPRTKLQSDDSNTSNRNANSTEEDPFSDFEIRERNVDKNINSKTKNDGVNGDNNVDKDMSLIKIKVFVNDTQNPYQNTTVNKNEDVSIEPRKTNYNLVNENRGVFKNNINSSNFSDEDDVEIIRKFYSKYENKPNMKNITPHVAVANGKDIFSEEDSISDIVVGPNNIFNKKEVDDIARNETDKNNKEIVTTTQDIFNDIDTEPDIIVSVKNINYNHKIDNITQNKNIENKIENKVEFVTRDQNIKNKLTMIENKLKQKEYEELGLSDWNENTNITIKKIPFDNDDDVWKDGKFKTPANKTMNKQKWKYKSDDDTKNKNSNANDKLLTDISASDLKDSDFSDIEFLDTNKGSVNKNGTRKHFSIFGSDDEQMRKQMFASDQEKGDNEKSGGEFEKLKNENSGGETEKVMSGSDNENLDLGKIGTNNDTQKTQSSDDENKVLKADSDARRDGTEKEEKDKTNKTDKEWDSYKYYKPDDLFIRNKYVLVRMDNEKRLANITLINRVNITFNAEMYYFVADDPVRFNRNEPPPGITMFRSVDPRAILINEIYKVSVYKNRLVQELHFEFASYASLVMRVYRRDPVIEVEWQVGPIPIADGIGKEFFIRYTTDLKNEGTFYTDSNGRQTVKRIRNRRYSYEPMNPDYLAGNIYPVTSKIYIEDKWKNIRFSVLNDRPQGGTSLADGEIDLFVHRRILTDDTHRGPLLLNETEYGDGIRVRGKHYIYLTKADYKPNRIFEKKLAKEIELAPQIFVTRAGRHGSHSQRIWMQQKNEYTALKAKLPIGVHILTLEKWGEHGNDLLLRLENYLESTDVIQKGVKKIKFKDLFVDIHITSIKETSLGANMWRNAATREKFYWNKKKEFYKSFNRAYGDGADLEYDPRKPRKFFEDVNLNDDIVLVPQQIRTFFVTYEYIGDM